MKAIFISYNQAYGEEISEILLEHKQKGYTRWQDIQGKGSFNGQPHMGSHAWPVMNNAILTVVKDERVEEIMADLKKKDEETPDLGLRAFVWNIEQAY